MPALLLCFLPLLAACQEKTHAVGVRGYNHTDQAIGQFQVDGGAGGSALAPHSGGGSLVCCFELPAEWRPGLEVAVRWTDGRSGNAQERVVAIPEYAEADAGYLSVHFLRDGGVKVFSTELDLWHPDYPLKGEEAELEPGVPPRGPWDD